MTIDERLERLTERHEALTLSVELRHADIGKLGGDLKKAEVLIVRMADGLATLSRIAQLHDRLNDLEHGA